MTIHTFGDSHSLFAWKDIKGVVLHYQEVGSRLCYSFGRDKLGLCNITNNIENKVLPNDFVVFCFGEIDCRFHIGKHISEKLSYKAIIDEIIVKYFEAINLNVNQIEGNIMVGIYNVPPVESPKTSYIIDPNEPKRPAGSDDDRKKFVKYFNEQLKNKCKEVNYLFVDVWEKYMDEDGFLNVKYSCGRQHMSDPIFLIQFLTEKGILTSNVNDSLSINTEN